MDFYFDRQRFNSYYFTLAQREADDLRCYARKASSRHLKNLISHLNFNNEIDRFINVQLSMLKKANGERECRDCLLNLREEKRLILQQDTYLSTGSAKVVASATLTNKLDTWGYVINGVGIVLASFQVVAGIGLSAASVAHGNIIGIAGGSLLVLHGYNSFKEGFSNIYYGRDNSVGEVKGAYIAAARFMGFDAKVGTLAYSGMDLVLSGYGMARMLLKPDAWRLFRYIPSDYVRNFRTMTPPSLLVEAAGDALSIKAVYDNAK